MKTYLLAGACALALASPALADGVSADALGTFGNVAGFPSWGVGASLNIPTGWDGISIDATGGAAGIGSAHLYNFGGNLMWSGSDFRLAGSVNYNHISDFGLSIDETQIGAGAQWFAAPWLTATVAGGGIAGSHSGGYFGADLKAYVCPDAALDGFVTYENIASVHITDYGVHAEYLPFEHLPVSIGVTYDHLEGSSVGPSSSTDSWWIGLKVYLNENGASTLVDRQRTGTLDTLQPSLHDIF
jgi:hypothetical protein